MSRAPQGARGLKYSVRGNTAHGESRAPQGARGLKFDGIAEHFGKFDRRAPQGARGLK